MACQSSSELALQLLKQIRIHQQPFVAVRPYLTRNLSEAFSVKQEDPMYLEEDKRVKIW